VARLAKTLTHAKSKSKHGFQKLKIQSLKIL